MTTTVGVGHIEDATGVSVPDATAQLVAYREDHVIDPEYPRDSRYRYDNYCRHDGIHIDQVKGGFRHDLSEVRRLVAIVPVTR